MVRVFEAFSGIGSQYKALKNLQIDCEIVATCEIDKYAVISYAAIHHNLKDKVEEFKNYISKNNISINYNEIIKKLEEKGYMKVNKKEAIILYIADKLSKNLGDISKIQTVTIPDHDLFTYSFPCQSISISGKMEGLTEGSGTHSSLLWECRKVIETKKPKYLLMENVKNLVSEKFKSDFGLWVDYLDLQGYNTYYQVLNAKDYRIPQNRERVFAVSFRKDIDNKNFVFPPKQELMLRVKDFIDNEVDEKYYYSEERNQKLITILKEKGLGSEVIGELDCVGKIDIKGHNYLKRVYNENGLCPTISTCQGGNTEPKIAHCPYSREYHGFKDISPTLCARDYKDPKTLIIFEERTDEGVRFFKDESVGTIRTINSGGDKRVYDGIQIRKLTPKECWLLMGFIDSDFYKASEFNSDSQLYKQAGNSIVVNVLESIFNQMFIINKYN